MNQPADCPLDKIGAAFLAMGADPTTNIVRLTVLCAEVLGADAAVYYRLDGGKLFAVARWGLPDDFPVVAEPAATHMDDIRAHPETIHRGDGGCQGYKSCAARLVRPEGAETGLLRVLYKEPRPPGANDDALMGLVAGALAVEERRLAAEREKKRLSEALRQSMKMEAVGLLVGGVAHDFNNSLTSICGNAEILRRRDDLSAEARDEAEEIAKAGRYAAALTRQLLAFSRKAPVDPVVFDLNGVLADLHKMLSRTVGERVKVALVPLPEPALVRADVGQIEQVVMNLAVNARDAMPDGGTLTLRVGSVAVAAETAPPGIRSKPGRYVVLSVADTGVGISATVRARLFEPFFTTKDPGKGTGLGLATVQGIVLQNDGAVTVESEPGRGAEFRVWLPAVAVGKEAEAAAAPVEEAPLAGKRVLLVEDEAPVRSLLARILRNAGIEVVEEISGDSAAIRAPMTAAPDALVTDIVMPGISGYELARRLRERQPALPIVFISGYADEETLDAASGCPNATVLMKPFSPSELVRRVRRALAGPSPRA
ncbi:MAG: response regulator [Elusimicrobia bacterium]|nr:response regulator [Elusimicrobiota bacterium]